MPSSRFAPVHSQAVVTIPHDGAQARQGKTWIAEHSVTVGTATAVTVLITTPATPTYEASIVVVADKAGSWTISEAPNASGGTAVVSYNRLRTGSNGALTVTHTATYTSSGTILGYGLVGSSGNPQNQVGGDSSTEPWILAPSTLYLARFVAGGATTAVVVRVSYDQVVTS